MTSIKVPVYHQKINQIKKMLKTNLTLGMILIDSSGLNIIEMQYGKRVYGRVTSKIKEIISGMIGSVIRKDDLITLSHSEGEQFYIFLSSKRKDRDYQEDGLATFAERVSKHVYTKIFDTVYPIIKKNVNIGVGYALAIYNPLIKSERIISKLIEDAKTIINYKNLKLSMQNKEKLHELILKEKIATIYHPIINLQTQEIIGYKSLSRGPKNTIFENPNILFEIAEEAGLLFKLDNICRKKIFSNAKKLEIKKELFMNMFPKNIYDTNFIEEYLKSFLKDLKISPLPVVLEISENAALENFDVFKKTTAKSKKIDFAISVIDPERAFSSIACLVRLNLKFIKLDLSLIRDLSTNQLRLDMLKAFSEIAYNTDICTIVEGIETAKEMNMLMELGLIYAQNLIFADSSSKFSKMAPVEIF